jgi:diacylglycerol kinase family enzyme
MVLTEKPKDGVGIAECIVRLRRLRKDTNSVVIVVGGDGTLGEVIHGLCRTTLAVYQDDVTPQPNVLNQRLPRILYLPSGTGADFARLGFCCTSIEDVIQALQSPRIVRIDIGCATFRRTDNQRFFINECSVGISADVILRTERYKKSCLRYLGGTIIFFISAIIALLQLTPMPMRIRRLPSDSSLASSDAVRITPPSTGKDGRRKRLSPQEVRRDVEHVGQWVDFPSSTIAFCNGKYFGGGMKIAPHGDPTDQSLAVTAWYCTFFPFVMRLISVYNGNHVKWSSTTTLEGCRFEVDSAEGYTQDIFCETDGEIAEQLPAIVECKACISMCLPPKKSNRNGIVKV